MDRLAEKVFIIGIDGMDPKFTKYMVEKGKMPNVSKLMEIGGMREDLVLLGNHPTVTPPMWTTLSTGATPMVHGIQAFSRNFFEDGLEYSSYNLDSHFCRAEQLWNVTAEAGIKTLVFHWPGCSWPPTSDSPNLHVVDGSSPGVVNMSYAQVEQEFVLVASKEITETVFRRKCASDTKIPCVITDLGETKTSLVDMTNGMGENKAGSGAKQRQGLFKSLNLTEHDGERGLSANPFDVELTPIKEAKGWADAPKDAKEFAMLTANGLLRRAALVTKNEAGVYDTISLYHTKKETKPYAILKKDVFAEDIVDKTIKDDVEYEVSRSMRILEMAEDGSSLKMWVSAAMDIHNDTLWHPQRLYQLAIEAAGNTPPQAILGGGDEVLISKCMGEQWTRVGIWYAKVIKKLIAAEGYEMIFSHFHNIDAQGHMLMRYLRGDNQDMSLSPEKILELQEAVYVQTDDYIGHYIDMLDDGWTLIVVSDHGQIVGPYDPPMLGDSGGVDIGVMRELGLTEVVKDENGQDTYEIDWSKTIAISKHANHIYLNLKGRTPHGIIDPKDRYEVEEEIITRLYGYRHPETGKRIITMALRAKDAIILGLGGHEEECGDIIYWLTEGYNYDHVDSIATTEGLYNTSVSPIFMAAGPGIKPGFTERYIRECDVVPTVATLLGVRMPAQCEGAPAYQVIDYAHIIK